MLLLFLQYFFIIGISCMNHSSVGSTLFSQQDLSRKCWSQEDLAKLQARRIFENLVIPLTTPDKLTNIYIRDMLRYYRQALRTAKNVYKENEKYVLRDALVDTIGAHFRKEVLPTARHAYYAGYISFRKTKDLHNFFAELKVLLNTQGVGWKGPGNTFPWANLTVEKIATGYGKSLNPCSCLVTKLDVNSCIHIPSPLLDDKHNPSAIVLPFRAGGLVSLTSPYSENILLKLYTTATRCILRKSPPTCRHSDFVAYHNELWHWMKRELAPHLIDEKLYTAFGGVLRVAAAVQNYGKGLTRRNLFDTDSDISNKWHPWRTLADSYVYINTDWTPTLYIIVVMFVLLIICVLQVCYNYIFGYSSGCHCKGLPSFGGTKAAYTANQNKIQKLSVNENSLQRDTATINSRQKSLSHGSVRTQKVYDLNENTEKLMDVILSDAENSDSPIAYKDESSEEVIEKHILDVGKAMRPKSPPQIQTDVTHLTIQRTPRKISDMTSACVYTTSITTEATCKDRPALSASSASCSTSPRSAGSASSTSSPRSPGSHRSLAWARRVVHKHSRHEQHSTSGTELDVYSFTTPPSHRRQN